ncbi:MAG TPA: GNAT family N-acetyltransferase [Terriglobia bacterium]|nr:GNAT family N-acetyltransferase [Terriglobia bacterium]
MNIETIENAEQFYGLRDEWNELLKRSASDTVFLTHEWLASWWKYLAEGRQLSILLARDKGQLVGILPVALREAQYSRMMPRVLELIGSGQIGSDYLDVIIAAGREPEVTAAFAEHLQQRRLMLQFSQLRTGACAVSGLANALANRGWIAAETKLNVCPYIDLIGLTWETYLDRLGSNIRKNLNRYFRILPKNFEMRLECAKAPEAAEAALEIVMELHKKRWEVAGTSEAFQSAEVIQFHREFVRLAAGQGWLRILVLWLNGQPAASLYGLRYGPTFYFYQSGFDPAFSKHSVGVATMGFAIKTAIEEGALEYDFLHGDEEYKFHWASATRDLGRIEVYPQNAGAQIYRQAIRLNRAARSMARRVLSKA